MIINCPSCSGPIMKTKDEKVDVLSASMRCPHCKKQVEVDIRMVLVVVVNGRKLEHLGDGPEQVRIM